MAEQPLILIIEDEHLLAMEVDRSRLLVVSYRVI
jgi:hypothetical protein